ncbi:hypothetical protein EBZ35_08330 [bacterium]|nr:hypothetical protein [bacterium]
MLGGVFWQPLCRAKRVDGMIGQRQSIVITVFLVASNGYGQIDGRIMETGRTPIDWYAAGETSRVGTPFWKKG